MTNVLNNGDKKWGRGGGRVGDNNIQTFSSYCTSYKNTTFLFIFIHICLFIKLKKLHVGQFLFSYL